jgi:soluble lytic murein transglycosylase-like protein
MVSIMKFFYSLVGLALIIISPWSLGATTDKARIESCIQSAANFRGQNPKWLMAIAVQESGLNPNAVNRANKNGSVDHGLFQINSAWLPTLARHGITEQQLYDPCIAAYVAAWILAQEIDRHGPTWRAIGAYNSPTEANQKVYVRRIQALYAGLMNGQR